jgi:hypothetical protein
MLANMSSTQFTEWTAFSRVRPFGAMREDYRAGLSAAAIINVNRGRDSELIRPLDFFDEYETPKSAAASTGGLTVVHAMAITMGLGGRVVSRSAKQ